MIHFPKRPLPFLVPMVLLLIAACTSEPIMVQDDGRAAADPAFENFVPGIPCEAEVISFKEQILPIMIASCGYSGCHSRESREDGVVLVDYASIRQEVTPGDPGDSELYEYLTGDPDDIMPPPPAAALTAQQKRDIRDWINQGANETDCAVPCQPERIAFGADIFPLLQDYCVGCHGDNRADGGVRLTSHAEVLRYVEDGSIIGTMEHAVSFSPMPPEAVRVPICRVEQVKNWIAAGAPNN